MASGLLRAALRSGNVRQVLAASRAASRRARASVELLPEVEGVRVLPAGSRLTTRQQEAAKAASRRRLEESGFFGDDRYDEIRELRAEALADRALARRRAKEWERQMFGRTLGRDYPFAGNFAPPGDPYSMYQVRPQRMAGPGYSVTDVWNPDVDAFDRFSPYQRFEMPGNSVGGMNRFPDAAFYPPGPSDPF